MMDSERFADKDDFNERNLPDDSIPGSLASKQNQLNRLAADIAVANQLALPSYHEAQGLDVGQSEDMLMQTPLSENSTEPSTLLEERLRPLLDSQDGDVDLAAIQQRLNELESEMLRHSENIMSTNVLDRFQAVQIEGHPLPDMTIDDVKSWIAWYKEQGNFQAAEVLGQAYDEFLRELNQKAIEGHLFQEKQDEFAYLKTELEWRQVQDEFLKTVPELKNHAKEVIDAVRERLNTDPMAPFLNKFVLVRDAIDALGIGPRLTPSSNSVSLPPDAQVRNRRVNLSHVEGQKTYRLSDLKAMDYRKMSADDLADLQHAMFEGRILADE